MVVPGKNGNAHRSVGGGGRSYGLMLLLALGAAILGVTVLHKLREGRLLSVVVKEKDHELISLHLLLQKEREFNKEWKKKLEEMKTNMYSASAQKSDVEGRLLEVNSLVSSLKDEMKTLESQLQEKQSEINTLKQQQLMPNETRVWSVSSDDPSIPPINFTQGSSNEGLYLNKNGTHSLSANENTKLEDLVEDGTSNSSTNLSNVNEDETSTEKLTKDGNGIVAVSEGLEDGKDSAMRVKNSKHRRFKRRRYRDLITRFTEGKNGHMEQNTSEAIEQTAYTKQDGYVALRTEEPLNMAETEEGKGSGNFEESRSNTDVE